MFDIVHWDLTDTINVNRLMTWITWLHYYNRVDLCYGICILPYAISCTKDKDESEEEIENEKSQMLFLRQTDNLLARYKRNGPKSNERQIG